MSWEVVQSIRVGQQNTKQGKQKWTFALFFKESTRRPFRLFAVLPPVFVSFSLSGIKQQHVVLFLICSFAAHILFPTFFILCLWRSYHPLYLFSLLLPHPHRFSLYALLSSWPPHIFRFNQTCLGASSASHGFWSAPESSWLGFGSPALSSLSLSPHVQHSLSPVLLCALIRCATILIVAVLDIFDSFTSP